MKESVLTTFAELGISTETTAALAAANIIEPFPIQAQTIPLALTGIDLIGQARTGTGKTFAFGLPLLERLTVPGDGHPQALVVVPTRELALQVAEDLELAGKPRGARTTTVYGGRAYEPQINTLRAGVDVVVGTPGRLLDLANQKVLDLSRVRTLVLDEADRMLDLGFLPDVERILRLVPEQRQSMLFSATMPAPIIALARRYLNRPTHIRAEQADESHLVPTTKQHVFRAHDLDKPEVLARVLQAEGRGLSIVFCRTKRECARVEEDLRDRGFAVVAVHGDLGQAVRERAMKSFRAGKADILVATDVAARGIDVEGVTHVVNYHCPEDEKAYVHRIGRTGRAGAAGVAVTFVDWPDLTRWQNISSALDLGMPEPPETYSTSPSLYEALNIPVGATGRLTQKPARKAETSTTTRRPSGRGRQRRRVRVERPQAESA